MILAFCDIKNYKDSCDIQMKVGTYLQLMQKTEAKTSGCHKDRGLGHKENSL